MERKELKAQELRIGNWLQCKGTNFQVDVQTIRTVLAFKTEIKPILLDPEILLKAGFVKTPVLQGNSNWYHSSGEFGISDFNGTLYFEGPFLDTQLPFVHQLQNLYHALTSHELTINL